jgi:hypothetical protein
MWWSRWWLCSFGLGAVLLWEQEANSKCGVQSAKCKLRTDGGTHSQFAFRISHLRHRSYFAPRPYDFAHGRSSLAVD